MTRHSDVYMHEATPKQTSEALFMKKLSNTEAEFKKSVAYKKKPRTCCYFNIYVC